MNARYDTKLSPMTRLIYSELQLRCNYGIRPTKITDLELSSLFGLTERSVSRNIGTLISRGYITKKKRLHKRYIYIVNNQEKQNDKIIRSN